MFGHGYDAQGSAKVIESGQLLTIQVDVDGVWGGRHSEVLGGREAPQGTATCMPAASLLHCDGPVPGNSVPIVPNPELEVDA